MSTPFIRMMKQEGIKDDVIRTFCAYYAKLTQGDTGYIKEEMIKPPSDTNLIEYQQIKQTSRPSLLKKIAIIKLNGGLGTSMGLAKAKSLLPVKNNMNFLDIISRQVLTLRSISGYNIPLLFMNSFNTETDTLKYLEKYPDLSKQNLPLSFLQNKYPRIRKDNLMPYENTNKKLMWNPPGHGDIYAALSGLLEDLITQGCSYAFISNADNLGAIVDTSIPTYMEDNKIPFVMEVCLRSPMDKKGGHLCEDKSGQLLLREVAQCPEDDLPRFQDVEYYKYFNTNNLWIDLKALDWYLISNDGILLLPLIVNPKIVEGTPVYQLETAMGSAISVFNNSKALIVSRERFVPVKKTNDLLALWSDVYDVNDMYQIVLKRGLEKAPIIELNETYYGKIDEMQKRFSKGIPSLTSCKKMNISGDVSFGEGVVCEGEVTLKSNSPVFVQNCLLTGEVDMEVQLSKSQNRTGG
ncbi:MAG: UTP--glucose-1-phosphate uridylyltransferase [Candidatus Cloacimonas sp.]